MNHEPHSMNEPMMEMGDAAEHYYHAGRGVSCPFPAYHRAQAVRLSGHPGKGLNPLTKLDYGPSAIDLGAFLKICSSEH